jgi:two-component system chemotaxis response regulator CheV
MVDLASERNSEAKVTEESQRQVVVFELGDQAFAVDVDSVREIIRAQQVRRVPQTPPSLMGVSTVRGDVLPVIDLASFLNIETDIKEDEKKFIIMEFNEEGLKVVLAVDTVRRIYNIPASRMDYTLKGIFMGDNLSCVIKQESENILMPDFDKIMNVFRSEIRRLSKGGSTQEAEAEQR